MSDGGIVGIGTRYESEFMTNIWCIRTATADLPSVIRRLEEILEKLDK